MKNTKQILFSALLISSNLLLSFSVPQDAPKTNTGLESQKLLKQVAPEPKVELKSDDTQEKKEVGKPDPNTSSCKGYSATSVRTTKNGFTANLKLDGPACNAYGQDIEDLTLKATYETNNRLHVKIYDTAKKQWQVPLNLIKTTDEINPAEKRTIKFDITKSPFSFTVRRVDNDEVIFSTEGSKLIFENEYLEISSSLPKDANIYGLGENVDSFRRDPENTLQPIWARDAANAFKGNSYGAHPFYMELRNSKSHGVLLYNSNYMDVILSQQRVTYKTLGGVLDFYFFSGPNPYQVIEQYTAFVGRPHQIPYWALGFQQCRYGYKDLNEVETVVEKYAENKIPLETMYTDIEHMDMFKDFTFDPIKFPQPKMKAFAEKLHKNNQRYVLIIDPAIARNTTYKTYLRGLEDDVYIKNEDGSIYYGQVWPGYTSFPDWFAPKTQAWWTREIKEFKELVPVDGVWIDMNEPASFCLGSCGTGKDPNFIPKLPWEELKDNPAVGASVLSTPPLDAPTLQKRALPNQDAPKKNNKIDKKDSDLNNPKYKINNFNGELRKGTIDMNSTYYGGKVEYDVHNLYGHMEGIATRKSMLDVTPGKRPFVLGRSTFIGSGAHVGHWTGDNHSEWDDLYWSIPGILQFQMFGIPYVGADICGFAGNTTEELCLRWMQLGSFYPFARNHNMIGMISQEPYLWKSVADASRRALATRYKLLPYFYTEFQKNHESGIPFWRPLAFEYPEDPKTAGIDKQFLVGPAVLITPVLKPNVKTLTGYFPEGIWYDWNTQKALSNSDKANSHVLNAPLDGDIPVHIRGGYIIPLQEPTMTITESRKSPFTLIIALDNKGQAAGDLYLDDGESLEVGKKFSKIKFNYSNSVLSVDGTFGYKYINNIQTIIVLGAKKSDKPLKFGKAAYSSASKKLTISGLNIPLNKAFSLSF